MLFRSTATEAGGAGDSGSYSMYRTLRWRKSINPSPKLTKATVKLINGLIPLLKSAQCLIECKDLSLTGNTVAPGEICSHRMRSRKISYLGPDLLKSAQCLIECKDLSLTGNTVAPGEICPHRMRSRKISYLGPDPRDDCLANHHLCGRVIRVPFLQLLEGVEKNRRDRRRYILVSN